MKYYFFFISFFLIQNISSQTITKREAFDFEISDEFHYSYNTFGQYPTPYRKEIIKEKHYNLQEDSLFYTIEKYNYNPSIIDTPSIHVEYEITIKTENLIITNLDSLVTFSLVDFEYDSITTYNDSMCFRKTEKNIFSSGYSYYCDYTFGKGIGQTFFSHSEEGSSTPLLEWSLIAYKKNNDSCGVPINIPLNINENTTSQGFKAFPNPAKNNFQLNFFDSKFEKQINIYNIFGQELLSITSNNSIENINVSNWKKGNYFVKITSNNCVKFEKLLVE